MMAFLAQHLDFALLIGYLILQVLAALAAIHAVMNARTAQGSVAWLIALLAIPVVALPFYAAFGRHRFVGYVDAHRAGNAAVEHVTGAESRRQGQRFRAEFPEDPARFAVYERMAQLPFSSGNEAELLIDGEAMFKALFAGISRAEDYVLVQFYIIRDDDTGQELRRHLEAALTRGVRVYLLFDAIGSSSLPRRYTDALIAAGAQVHAFAGTRWAVKHLQINFRNHRKLVVVDGKELFIGGFNVGDDYLGRYPALSPWRDTHVRVRGPAAIAAQIPFLEDWFWASGELPTVHWEPQPASQSNQRVLVLPGGPADSRDTCGLFFLQAIHAARHRLWIVSPYFVPNSSIIDALQLAALRGVDVRILLPQRADSRLVQLAGYAYVPELVRQGVKLYRYHEGFLHQKVLLADDDFAAIGTANLDNRSFRLNFEILVLVADKGFAARTGTMLEDDFARSHQIDAAALEGRRWWFRAAARGARLLSPIL
ncbi:MAG: cardiolipin synthase [Pseudomonadales bacterium]|nr:cardiolipin synthase [Pseudomonadales bacterium]